MSADVAMESSMFSESTEEIQHYGPSKLELTHRWIARRPVEVLPNSRMRTNGEDVEDDTDNYDDELVTGANCDIPWNVMSM